MALDNKPPESQKLQGAADSMLATKPEGNESSVDDQADISSEEDFSDVDEKKVLRKMDLRLIPMLALLYLLSFLDRGNIGNARIEGLEKDLNLRGSQYNWCYSFQYPIEETEAINLYGRISPLHLCSRGANASGQDLPSIMIAWGTVMTLMGLVKNYKGLLIARIFLGVAEAGLYPGCAYYITMWYCSKEGQLRQALFFSAASIAGAFSGLLAFAIAKMHGVGGLEGWRWIFILEGLATVLVAIMAFFTIYDFPETASFFTERERAFVIHRLKPKLSSGIRGRNRNLLEYSLINASVLGYRLPAVPVYCTAAIIAIGSAWVADKRGQRSPFILFYMSCMAIGFIICIASAGRGLPGVVYAGVFIAVCGLYPAFPGNITWLSSNLAGSYKRATGMAIQIGIGNLSGAMASNFYRPGDAPKYYTGHGLQLAFVTTGIISVLILRFSYQRINKKRDLEGTGDLSEQQLADMGDKSPGFRYSL
ncbi:conserved hypothetical protein [Uncinocarpus reesii 1704]|uniref:Major facilitator superfamily (MFS) profile domain-containing protein n=1 Tax=Uncinocarpus reesii (strain UAMH 1704) TaxID=336963 RepID=C4JNA1_UNCRE|nr:uncharacterized protein UREG_04307 [Uncinocarpus reesii 1704]EEP79461.1 conserved hypothetical protein [Uncinocarpus reesii 1704]